MTNVEPRLIKCFSTVFPALTEDQIRTASPRTVKEWDSVAAITLLTVLEEEFEVTLDFELLSEKDSFDAIALYLGSL